jgi:hypothetical protein
MNSLEARYNSMVERLIINEKLKVPEFVFQPGKIKLMQEILTEWEGLVQFNSSLRKLFI